MSGSLCFLGAADSLINDIHPEVRDNRVFRSTDEKSTKAGELEEEQGSQYFLKSTGLYHTLWSG